MRSCHRSPEFRNERNPGFYGTGCRRQPMDTGRDGQGSLWLRASLVTLGSVGLGDFDVESRAPLSEWVIFFSHSIPVDGKRWKKRCHFLWVGVLAQGRRAECSATGIACGGCCAAAVLLLLLLLPLLLPSCGQQSSTNDSDLARDHPEIRTPASHNICLLIQLPPLKSGCIRNIRSNIWAASSDIPIKTEVASRPGSSCQLTTAPSLPPQPPSSLSPSADDVEVALFRGRTSQHVVHEHSRDPHSGARAGRVVDRGQPLRYQTLLLHLSRHAHSAIPPDMARIDIPAVLHQFVRGALRRHDPL